MFNVEAYLQWQKIPYHVRGPNCCTICPKHAVGKHTTNLDIIYQPNVVWNNKAKEYYKPGTYNCWVCEEKGDATKLVQLFSQTNPLETYRIVKKFTEKKIYVDETPIEQPTGKNKIEFPPCFEPVWVNYNAGLEYLEDRGRTSHEARIWDLQYANPEKCIASQCSIFNEVKQCFRYRLIFPHYDWFGKLLCWQGRDVTNDSEVRYKSTKTEVAVAKTKDTLFGIQLLKTLPHKKYVLAEGPFDAFSWGPGCLAKTGTKLTLNQINILVDLDIEELTIFPDPPDETEDVNYPEESKGYKGAIDDATQLCSYINTVRIARPLKYDLGEMPKEEQMELYFSAEVFD